jgi:hypothetical protein
MGSVLRKRVVAGQIPTAPASADCCPVFVNYPGIWEMMTADIFAGGEKRLTSTVTLFYEAGVVKVCLNDRENGLTAWSSGVTPSDALDALESGLQADSLAWREGGKRVGKKGGK